MEISYRREMKHNYLIIVPEESIYNSYEVRMMASNCIEGLLRFHVKQVDNKKSYYYEITSKQPLARLLERQSLGAGRLRRLVEGIARTLERMETFLLQEEQIFLDAEYIYVDTENFSVYLCLIPGRQGSFPAEMNALLQYLLGKVNHQDKECVVMAYGLYQESLKENYGMGDLLRLTAGFSGKLHAEEDEEIREQKWRGESEWEEVCEPGKGYECGGEYDRGREHEQGKEYGRGKEYGSERGREHEREKKHERGKAYESGKEHRSGKACGEIIGDNPVNIKFVCRNLLITCAVLVGGPTLGLTVLGGAWAKKYWFLFLLADILTAAFSAAGIYKAFHREDQREEYGLPIGGRELRPPAYEEERRIPLYEKEYAAPQRNRGPASWQMMFQDEEDEEAEPESCKYSNLEMAEEPCVKACSTVLLTEREESEGIRRFKSMDAEVGDIVISYVPFIIGKQEGLTDCILEHEGVSRLHARIDRNGEEYLITDLNSTNGTRVGGRLLETNEVAVLNPGDEVYIANVGFVFT